MKLLIWILPSLALRHDSEDRGKNCEKKSNCCESNHLLLTRLIKWANQIFAASSMMVILLINWVNQTRWWYWQWPLRAGARQWAGPGQPLLRAHSQRPAWRSGWCWWRLPWYHDDQWSLSWSWSISDQSCNANIISMTDDDEQYAHLYCRESSGVASSIWREAE